MDDLSWLDLVPSHLDKLAAIPSSKERVYQLVVNLLCDFDLSALEQDVPDTHEHNIERQGNPWEAHWNRLVSACRVTR